MSPRTGRPKLPNPNIIKLTIRLNPELSKALEEYCIQYEKSKGEAVREGLEKLLAEKEQK